MNARKLLLIVLLYCIAAAAWSALGGTIADRTKTAQAVLGAEAGRMFGPEQVQPAPAVADDAAGNDGRPPDATDIAVSFEHEHRYRGLVWFSVYRVRFRARFTVRPRGQKRAFFRMGLPQGAHLDGLVARAGGRDLAIGPGEVFGPLAFADGRPVEVEVGYDSAGMDSWRYDPQGRGLREFRLVAETDFDEIDYPSSGLSPTVKAVARPGGGRRAEWRYARMLLAHGGRIGLVMPSRPPAGELAERLARFAPVSFFFFLAVMVTLQVLRSLPLHPMHYLLVAAGYFAFHILLAYLVDHIAIHAAFGLAAAVSVFLVVSYLRLVLGWRAALLTAGGAQLFYLVFFSYAFFWEGWTGLTIVAGAIVTLFVIMQLTGKVDWDANFPDLARRPERAPAAVG